MEYPGDARYAAEAHRARVETVVKSCSCEAMHMHPESSDELALRLGPSRMEMFK
jgi:hypothetical protein